MTIVEFLTARLDEDKAVVQSEPRWADPGYELLSQFGDYGDTERFTIEIGAARVLAEIAAKRRIIELHRPIEDKSWLSGEPNNWLWCTSCGSTDDRPVAYPCDTLRLLAQPYADHPDFDPAWSVA